MLGIRKQQNFQASACGKHPAFSDYFSVNIGSPLAGALTAWVENGMAESKKPDRTRIPRSFRFWVRGIKKEDLILGVLRESSDSMGRVYPLMIMGNLVLTDRDRRWPTLFEGFDPVFRAFESMTTTAYDRFKDFENGLLSLGVPVFEKAGEDTPLSRSIRAWFARDRDQEVLTLPVTRLTEKDAGSLREREGRGFFRKRPEVPGSVFLGGLPQNPEITIYSRALRTRDFLTLFHLGGKTDNTHKGELADGY